MRITDAGHYEGLKSHIQLSRQKLATAQEQLSTGKKINRPSDDPAGAAAVIRLQTNVAEVEQFTRNVSEAQTTLENGDQALNSYQQLLDRASTLLTQASSTTTLTQGKSSLATELDSLTEQIRQIANTKSGDGFFFGGSRLSAAPFDSNGVPAATPAVERTLQVDPGGTIISMGPLAENVFSDSTGSIIDALKTASAAIRGTGDPVADQATELGALDRIKSFSNLADTARTQLGSNLAILDHVTSRLSDQNLSYQQSISDTESVDIAAAALNLTQASTGLDAILQATAKVGQKSLLDFLG